MVVLTFDLALSIPRRHLTIPETSGQVFRIYSVFDLNVQVESTTGGAGITGKSKSKHPRDPRVPRGLLLLNIQVKNALDDSSERKLEPA
jgi:hypothetical protein